MVTMRTAPTAPADVAAVPEGTTILVIRAPFYREIATELTAGALAVLEGQGVDYEIVDVPGALEIPLALASAVAGGRFQETAARPLSGAIAIGCVIRGETTHYEIVAGNANHWLMRTAVQHALPLGNAILTVENKEQALARARGGAAGKGGEAARACLALVALQRKFGKVEA